MPVSLVTIETQKLRVAVVAPDGMATAAESSVWEEELFTPR